MDEAGELLTTQEAAAILGISDSWLRQLLRSGVAVPSKLIGGTSMYSRAEVERLRPLVRRQRKSSVKT